MIPRPWFGIAVAVAFVVILFLRHEAGRIVRARRELAQRAGARAGGHRA